MLEPTRGIINRLKRRDVTLGPIDRVIKRWTDQQMDTDQPVDIERHLSAKYACSTANERASGTLARSYFRAGSNT